MNTQSSESVRDPEFVMPCCVRHWRYRWWCRYCRSEAEGQFRAVCGELWRRQAAERVCRDGSGCVS